MSVVTAEGEAAATAVAPEQRADRYLATLQPLIRHLAGTLEESWCTDVVRQDGLEQRNCLLGHIHALGGGEDRYGSALCGLFEERWASTYRFYPVNDGADPDYPQSTPKQRVLAFLADLAAGRVLRTPESMDAEWVQHLVADAAGVGGVTVPEPFPLWLVVVPERDVVRAFAAPAGDPAPDEVVLLRCGGSGYELVSGLGSVVAALRAGGRGEVLASVDPALPGEDLVGPFYRFPRPIL